MGHSIADTRTCCKKGGTSTKVAIGTRAGIGASSSKDVFKFF
jgi:hypothetical protein